MTKFALKQQKYVRSMQRRVISDFLVYVEQVPSIRNSKKSKFSKIAIVFLYKIQPRPVLTCSKSTLKHQNNVWNLVKVVDVVVSLFEQVTHISSGVTVFDNLEQVNKLRLLCFKFILFAQSYPLAKLFCEICGKPVMYVYVMVIF